MRKKLNKIRIAMLKLITTIATITLFIAGCALDSKSKLPFIVCAICIGWISIMAAANQEG